MNTDMRFRGSFSFINNSIYVVRIDRNNRMVIRTTGQGIAVLFFIDRRTRRRVNIPAGFQVRQMGGPILIPFARMYHLNWINSYEVSNNGVVVFRSRQQMQHSVESPIT